MPFQTWQNIVIFMKTKLHLDYRKILTAQPQPVHFALEFIADAIANPRSKPAAFCIVLDRSGSMGGPPLEKAKQAIAMAIRNLRQGDLFGLVVFDDAAQVVIPLQKVSSREGMISILQGIIPGGSTNLTGGWMLGRDELKKAPTDTIRRLLVLSDGLLNVGLTDPVQVRQIVGQGLEMDGIRTACLGLGNNYDEKLLSSLAEATNGEFYDADSPDKFPEIFSQELEGLQRLSVQNLRVRVKPLDFCEWVRQMSTCPTVQLPDGRQEFALGDLMSEEQRVLCLEIGVLPLPCISGTPVTTLEGEVLIEVEILCDEISAAGIASRCVRQVVRIQGTQNPAEVTLDETVVPWVAMQKAGQALKSAHDLADRGDLAGAIGVLETTLMFLQKYGTQDKVSEAVQMLAQLRERLQMGGLSVRDRKLSEMQRYRSSKLSKKDFSAQMPDALQPPPPPPMPPPQKPPEEPPGKP